MKRKASSTFKWKIETLSVIQWWCFLLEWLVFHTSLQIKLFVILHCSTYPQREHSIFALAVHCPSPRRGASCLPAHDSASGSGHMFLTSSFSCPFFCEAKGCWTPRQALRCFFRAFIHALGSLGKSMGTLGSYWRWTKIKQNFVSQEVIVRGNDNSDILLLLW